jgi:hypothetical protein
VMKSDEILIKTFDQVKNDNFDQVKFDQVIVCLYFDLCSQSFIFCLFGAQISTVAIIFVTLFQNILDKKMYLKK